LSAVATTISNSLYITLISLVSFFGRTCEGEPGRRPDPHQAVDAAYVRDPLADKLEALTEVFEG